MDVPEKRRESSLRKANKSLGVRLFKRAPEGFNPITARARELLTYGYPARPDAMLHPQLHELWAEMISRPMQIIDPEFAVMTDKGHGRHTVCRPGLAGVVASRDLRMVRKATRLVSCRGSGRFHTSSSQGRATAFARAGWASTGQTKTPTIFFRRGRRSCSSTGSAFRQNTCRLRASSGFPLSR